MAFQQQHHRAAPARPVLYTDDNPPKLETALLQTPRETEEWVLFSPAQNRTEGAASTATPQTQPLSYFGSIDTTNRSNEQFEDDQEEDLDSLDDGLHAFDDPRAALQDTIDQSATVLPTHDGLGTFPGTSSPVQTKFWQHEQAHNQSKQKSQTLRRDSLQKHFEALERQPSQRLTDEDKTQRIEQWRQDQSRAILEEIEKETKRLRRRSRMSSSQYTESTITQLDTPRPSDAFASPTTSTQESWWQRFTRQIIQNLIGIDDATMSFIFGGEATGNKARNASTQEEMIRHAEEVIGEDKVNSSTDGSSWDERLLARVAKELGLLINKISEHPGDFEGFLRSGEDLPYAGLPDPHARPRSSRHRHASRRLHSHSASVPSTPTFEPTLPSSISRFSHRRRRSSTHATDPSLWGIEEEEDATADGADLTPVATRIQHDASHNDEAKYESERAYWEKDLDIGMVYQYLKTRLSSKGTSDTPQPTDSRYPTSFRKMTTSYSSSRNSDSLRRVALIRHHHPLVASAAARSTEGADEDVPSPATEASLALLHPEHNAITSAAPAPILGRRPSSSRFLGEGYAESCASQSTTKKSKTKHSGSLASLGSSRNYWDLGNSGGAWSGSGWGEV